MNEVAQPSGPRGRRRFWWGVRLVVWPLVLIWFGWFAHVRWTTPPAGGADLAPSVGRGEFEMGAVESAAGSVPPYSAAGSSRPSRWDWWCELVPALRGAWDPAGRQDLVDIVAYLSKPRTASKLDAVVSACNDFLGLDRAQRPGRGTLYQAVIFDPHGAAWALAARARWRQAEERDLPAALSNLRAAMCLDAWAIEWRMYGYGTDGVGAGLFELLQLAKEVDVPPALAAEMIGFMGRELSLSPRQVLRVAGAQSADAQALLDQYYTNDGQGNGWLVVSSLPAVGFGMRGTAASERSHFWNLFSPLFNDRRTAAAKLSGLGERLGDLDRLSYEAVISTLSESSGLVGNLSVVDAPLSGSAISMHPDRLKPAMQSLVWRRAAVVMLALSAYKAEHGEYPLSLAELVPTYLSELPRDFLTADDFVYERVAPDAYDLRSARPMSERIILDPFASVREPIVADRYSIGRPPIKE